MLKLSGTVSVDVHVGGIPGTHGDMQHQPFETNLTAEWAWSTSMKENMKYVSFT